MNIQSLRYVITLAEELHFGRAPGRHYIVPQAFGRQVQRLERELGVRLFDRTSRRVALTAAGVSAGTRSCRAGPRSPTPSGSPRPTWRASSG